MLNLPPFVPRRPLPTSQVPPTGCGDAFKLQKPFLSSPNAESALHNTPRLDQPFGPAGRPRRGCHASANTLNVSGNRMVGLIRAQRPAGAAMFAAQVQTWLRLQETAFFPAWRTGDAAPARAACERPQAPAIPGSLRPFVHSSAARPTGATLHVLRPTMSSSRPPPFMAGTCRLPARCGAEALSWASHLVCIRFHALTRPALLPLKMGHRHLFIPSVHPPPSRALQGCQAPLLRARRRVLRVCVLVLCFASLRACA